MKLCASTASLRSCTLEEAAAITRALGFDALDVEESHLDRDKILAGERGEVERVRALNMVIPNFMWTFARFSLSPSINDPDPAVRARNMEQFRRVLDFCRQIDALSLLIYPGVIHTGQKPADARALAAEAFNEMLPLARSAGITLVTEPHLRSAFESPDSVLRLCEQAPGLRIVLDYSHFICQGYTQPAIDGLCPHTGHVHLRQAKNGLLQTSLEGGTINFVLVVDQLERAGYTGYLCVEYVHQNFLGADNVDVITETVKMRDLMRTCLP